MIIINTSRPGSFRRSGSGASLRSMCATTGWHRNHARKALAAGAQVAIRFGDAIHQAHPRHDHTLLARVKGLEEGDQHLEGLRRISTRSGRIPHDPPSASHGLSFLFPMWCWTPPGRSLPAASSGLAVKRM